MKWHLRIWKGATIVSGLLLMLFFVLNQLGWKENLTVLTGTIPLNADFATANAKAMAYLICYFAAALLVPVLMLMTVISWIWVRLSGLGKKR